MECLHHPTTAAKAYPVEHVYSLQEIDQITNKIAADEWAALGSVIAEQMLEMILDIGKEALCQRPGVDRMRITDKIAEEISNDVEKTLYKIRLTESSRNAFDQGHHLPEQLLSSLETLLRHELGTIIGLDGSSTNSQFNTDGHNLSILVLSTVSKAIEQYCSISNVNAPFFNLSNEMDNRVRDRRRELLLKHSAGYESVQDVLNDIETSRLQWMRDTLGGKSCQNYEFGEVTTKIGNKHSHLKEKKMRDGRRSSILNALFIDFDGVLMP